MEPVSTIINRILSASPIELEGVLDSINREVFQNSGWDFLSVKSSYSTVLEEIADTLSRYERCLHSGTGEEVIDFRSSVLRIAEARSAIMKLQRAESFFRNPPVVENPNPGGRLSLPTIDWNKPVYTADEVKALLGVSDSTFRRWLYGGWISYTQMDGSDKKFIQKEHLMAFFNNPKIFYPSSK